MTTATLPTRPASPAFAPVPSDAEEGSLLATARRLFAERCARALAGGADLIGRYPLGGDGHCTCPDAMRLRHVRRALEAQGIETPLACKHAISADLYRRHRAGMTTRVPVPGGFTLTIRPKGKQAREGATR